jgi:hypothetical protein
MPNPPFEYKFDLAKTTVTIDATGISQPMNAELLEFVMEWLGKLRAEMLPSVPDKPLLTTRPHPITMWTVGTQDAAPPADVGAAIGFRSAEFGWFVVRLPAADCRKFAQLLLRGEDAAALQ